MKVYIAIDRYDHYLCLDGALPLLDALDTAAVVSWYSDGAPKVQPEKTANVRLGPNPADPPEPELEDWCAPITIPDENPPEDPL